MRKSLAISIPEPCHEDWTKMTPTERGAFCQACAIDVMDFTGKTAHEIKTILRQEISADKRTCMRITNYQLDQINDDYFHWKNDTEAFRTVWIFSLIAVFGLTLFSCQNTLSKELVNQMNIEATELLAEIDSNEISLNDTTNLDEKLKVNEIVVDEVVRPPWVGEIITSVGVPFVLDPHELEIKWEICSFILGDVTVNGYMGTETGMIPSLQEFLSEAPMNSPFYSPIPQGPLPLNDLPSNPVPRPYLPKLEGITGSGDKKFTSFIHPNPVDDTSRLYLEMNDFAYLKITIHEGEKSEALRSGHSPFSVGRHAVDLKLYSLKTGAYQLRIEALNQVSVLDFEV
jgi:hypothetical protein